MKMLAFECAYSMGVRLSEEAACLLRSLTWASRGFSCCSFVAMARRAASCCSSRSFTCTAMTGAMVLHAGQQLNEYV